MFLILIAASVIITLISSFFLIDTGAGRIQEGRPITTIGVTRSSPGPVDENLADTADFVASKLIPGNQIIVQLKKTPLLATKQKAEDWLKQKYPTANLCDMKISFVPAKGVQGQFKPSDSVPTGCSVPERPTPERTRVKQ